MHSHDRPALGRVALLLGDAFLMTIAWFNVVSMRDVPALPEEYQPATRGLSTAAAHVGAARTLLRIEGHEAELPELLRYYLGNYSIGDSVTVVDVSDGIVSERRVRLVPKYTSFNLGTIVFVGTVFFVFGIYIIVQHASSHFARVLHAVTVGTALMVLYDWGSMKPYLAAFNALRWFIFDVAIWTLPSLFLHFSFLYPNEKKGHRRLALSLFYLVSLGGLAVSAYYLTQIFFFGRPLNDTHYLDLHARGSDVFLIAGLLCTVANLEHSALTIQNPYDRKRIYWVLLGISFGPLVYVFLILVPRIMLDYELVSQSMMQFTLLMAPLMFYLAVRKTPDAMAAHAG